MKRSQRDLGAYRGAQKVTGFGQRFELRRRLRFDHAQANFTLRDRKP